MKITVKQLRQIIREEVVRNLRLTEANKTIKADEFAQKADAAGVDLPDKFDDKSDVEIVPGDGGTMFKQNGKSLEFKKFDDANKISRQLYSRSPMGRGERGGGG